MTGYGHVLAAEGGEGVSQGGVPSSCSRSATIGSRNPNARSKADSRTILIVDDQEVNRRLLENLLIEFCHRPLLAADGPAALVDLLAASTPPATASRMKSLPVMVIAKKVNAG